jgi:hypothetical protein
MSATRDSSLGKCNDERVRAQSRGAVSTFGISAQRRRRRGCNRSDRRLPAGTAASATGPGCGRRARRRLHRPPAWRRMNTKEVLLGDVRVHLAIPSDAEKHQAVIVIGEEPTAATELIHVADLLSGLARVTLAFPLLAQQFDGAQLKHSIAEAIIFLNDRPDVRHGSIAVWSLGAGCGAIASTVPGIAAAIILHLDAGTGPTGDWHPAAPFDPHDVQCPVLLIFATSRLDADDVIQGIRSDLEGAGKMVEIQHYDAPASQTSVTMESFPARVIADRWDHVQAFLRRHLS